MVQEVEAASPLEIRKEKALSSLEERAFVLLKVFTSGP
jgi:hypothetical protein